MRPSRTLFRTSATRAIQLVDSWEADLQGDREIQRVRVRMRQFGVFIAMEHEEIGKALGISGAEVRVLMALRRAGAPFRMRPTDLVESLVAPSSSMARQLEHLTQRGFIKRVASADDARVSAVALTRSGVAAAERALRDTQAASPVSTALANLPSTELRQLNETLEKLLQAVANASPRD